MIIHRLVLKNFKRYRDQTICFKDGITGILGNNGAGKSSIVEAIFFALYGIKATGIAADYIVSSFASPKERCEVRLDFGIGGSTYTVLRTFKKGKTVTHDATFHKDGKLVATGVSQVEVEVRRTLGMGPVDFRNTVYAAQKDLLTLLDADPAKRREWFQRALGIDYLKTESQEILRQRIEEKNANLLQREGECKALIERQAMQDDQSLAEQIAAYQISMTDIRTKQEVLAEKKNLIEDNLRTFSEQKIEHTRLTERLQSLIRETDGLIRQRDFAKAKLIDLAKQEQEFQALELRVSGYQEKKQAFEKERIKKQSYENLKTEIQFSGKSCADLKDRAERTRANILYLNREAARMTALGEDIKRTLSLRADVPAQELEQMITSRENEIQHAMGTCSSRLKHLGEERNKLLSDYTKIRTAGPDGICPLCHQKLGGHFISIGREFESRLTAIQDQVEHVRKEQEQVSLERDRINSIRPALAGIRSLLERQKTLESLETELNDLCSQLSAKQLALVTVGQKMKDLMFDEVIYSRAEKEMLELENLQARFHDLRENIARGSTIRNQVADLEIQITQKQARITQLKTDIDNSSFDPKQGVAIEQARKEIESAINLAATEMVRTTERLRQTEEKIKEFKIFGRRTKELKKEIDEFKDEIELLKLTRAIIADYVVYLMQVVRSRIEAEVSRIISDITGGRYEQVLLDEDFNLLVRDIDDDYAIERFSGGEQDDIAVALRIALSRYLAELHNVHESTLLIFDEIFGSQDEERRTSLLTSLRTQESRFPQIILISHISEMQGEFANTLVVEMGTDMVSRVREAGE
jgi:DNA repair protein SbcC/Rad50